MSTIYWFTQDLRLNHNSGFVAACQKAQRNPQNQAKVIPLYILDDTDPWAPIGAQHWWLHHSLNSLGKSLSEKGGRLVLRTGKPIQQLSDIFQQQPIEALYFARAYDQHNIQLQAEVKTLCDTHGVECRRFSSRLLQEPEQILNGQGLPFKVFTPFSKKFVAQLQHQSHTLKPKSPPSTLRLAKNTLKSDKLSAWSLCPTQPNWAKNFQPVWQPGEDGAQRQLTVAIADIVANYAENRDLPAVEGTSRLSPHLHFGEISAAKIWYEISSQLPFDQAFPYLRQLIWREFSHSLLFNWPQLPTNPFNPRYEKFPWKKNKKRILAWQRGQTGYPLVDAGMQQLWQTGWMHNRVRMVVASFLTKHLLVPWQVGAEWFWHTLVDADLANNAAGWQWVAGCGADAAPYFRIFNPITQSEKFDPDGNYIREWLPQLSHLPNKMIHQPWLARDNTPQDYPAPIVEHSEARAEALSAYERMKQA